MSNTIPESWKINCVNEFAKLSAGGTPSTANREYWQNGSIPWMSSGEVSKKRIYKVDNYITDLGYKNSAAKLLPRKAVLIALAGQGKTRGTVAISEIELTTNQSIAAILVREEKCVPDFLFHNLSSRYEELRNISTGGGREGLNLAILGGVEVCLPLLPEQQKIAAILTAVDDVIESTQAQINKLKDLKAGMMQELLTKGIGHTEFKDSPVGRIPAEWKISKLGDAVVSKGLQTGPFGSQLHAHEYVELGIPVIMPKDMKDQYVVTDSIAKITQERANELSRHKVEVGDILFSRRGDIGRCVIVREKNRGWICGTGCLKARLSSELDPGYFICYLTLSNVVEWLNNNAVGQTMLNLNTSILAELPVILPSIEEQRIIADSMNSLISTLEAKEAKLIQLNSAKKALMQDLLTGKVRVNVN